MLQSSGITRKSKAMIVRHGQKKKITLFSIVENPSTAYYFGTTGPIQVVFSAECTSPRTSIKCTLNHTFNFRLISLDHITNVVQTSVTNSSKIDKFKNSFKHATEYYA